MRLVLAALTLIGFYWILRSQTVGSRPRPKDLRKKGEGREESVVYAVVEHDGGWAYKVGDVFSEAFATKEEALAAAERAATAHRAKGSEEVIQYQDRQGRWHEEVEAGDDRPDTRVDPSTAASG